MTGGSIRHTQKVPVAVGCMRKGMLKVVCAFDPETFEQIRNRAIKEGTSFAEQVRTLVEWGIDSDA
jgi:hypothetical protein